MMVFLLLSIIFMFFVGLFVLLESKFLSFCHCSVGVNSSFFIFLNLFYFFLDFIKCLNNFFHDCFLNESVYYFILFIIIFLFYFFNTCFLLFNEFGNLLIFSNFFILFLEVFLLVFNLNVFSFYLQSSYFHFIVFLSFVSIFIFLEGLSFLFYFIIIFCFSLTGVNSYFFFIGFYFDSCDYNVGIFVNIFIYYIFIFVVIINSFSGPFDYSEMESELVSGISIEFSSLFFSVWMLTEYGLILVYINIVLSCLFIFLISNDLLDSFLFSCLVFLVISFSFYFLSTSVLGYFFIILIFNIIFLILFLLVTILILLFIIF